MVRIRLYKVCCLADWEIKDIRRGSLGLQEAFSVAKRSTISSWRLKKKKEERAMIIKGSFVLLTQVHIQGVTVYYPYIC